MKIESIETRLYYIPLPEVLSDSTRGEMRYFGLVAVEVRGDGGEEGLGYTYAVGKTGAAAIRAMIERDIAPLLIGEDPRRTEYLWGKMWWAAHYVGRGGVCHFRGGHRPVGPQSALGR